MYDDILRAAVIAILALSTGAVLAVCRLHALAFRRAPRAGLTPLHVLLVSLGVLILQATLAWALIETLGRDIPPQVQIRTALYGVGSLIVLVALYVVGGIQRRRVVLSRRHRLR